jgi:hypothetical protein
VERMGVGWGNKFIQCLFDGEPERRRPLASPRRDGRIILK